MKLDGVKEWNSSFISSQFSISLITSMSTGIDPMDCILQGSSVHQILQVRILEWVAIPFSRGSSQSRDQTWITCTVGGFFTIWAIREAQDLLTTLLMFKVSRIKSFVSLLAIFVFFFFASISGGVPILPIISEHHPSFIYEFLYCYFLNDADLSYLY